MFYPQKITGYICFSAVFLTMPGVVCAQSSEGAFVPPPGAVRVGVAPLPSSGLNNQPVGRSYEAMDPAPVGSLRGFSKSTFNTTNIPGKVIYLNGENITAIHDQELENVNVRIDKNGNIYIAGPQYEVSSQQSYHPLLPKELPTFKKEALYEQPSLPQGVYSKQSGKAVGSADVEGTRNADAALGAAKETPVASAASAENAQSNATPAQPAEKTSAPAAPATVPAPSADVAPGAN